MSREEKLREMAEQEQALMREIYGFDAGVKSATERITMRIKDQICFDALADPDGRCSHHGGKCYELGLLVQKLINGGV